MLSTTVMCSLQLNSIEKRKQKFCLESNFLIEQKYIVLDQKDFIRFQKSEKYNYIQISK